MPLVPAMIRVSGAVKPAVAADTLQVGDSAGNGTITVVAQNPGTAKVRLEPAGASAELFADGNAGTSGFNFTSTIFDIYMSSDNETRLRVLREALDYMVVRGGSNNSSGKGNHLVLQGGRTSGAGAYAAGDLILRGGAQVSGGTEGSILVQNAAATARLMEIPNAAELRVYNAFTDASNHERVSLRWTSNVFEIAAASVGTGTLRGMVFGIAGNSIGFYGVTPTARQVLATGTGKTVDNVITALQTLGLVSQT